MLNVIEATPSELGEYAKFPMALLVESIFKVDIIDNGFGGFQLVEQRVKTPWVKDYGEEGDDTNVTRSTSLIGSFCWPMSKAGSPEELLSHLEPMASAETINVLFAATVPVRSLPI